MQTGKLEAIWRKTAHGEPLTALESVELVGGQGMLNDLHFGDRRQVTVIEKEVWDLLSEQMGRELEPTIRRANLMVSGLPLLDSAGRILQVGSVRIRVRGETQPCQKMDGACYGLREKMALMWRGGVWGDVLDDGEIRTGDAAAWLP